VIVRTFAEPAIELINTIRLRWMAERLGFEKIVLKNRRLIGYFVSNPSSHLYKSEVFTNVLRYVQGNQKICRMKQDKKQTHPFCFQH